MTQRGTHNATRSRAHIDPAAIGVAVILVAGLVGIGAGVMWRDGRLAQPTASSSTADMADVQDANMAGEAAAEDAYADANNTSGGAAGSDTLDEAQEQTDVAASDGQGAAASGNKADAAIAEEFDAQSYFATQHYGENGTALYNPLIIGDSVTVACLDQLNAAFPYGLVDAEVSHNVWESPYAAYRDQGTVGQVVIFCLGTNNAVVDWQIDDELLNMVEEDKTVFFVNTRSNQAWTESTNQTLADIPSRHANVASVLDWYGYSQGHDEWFAGDGTHPNEESAQVYAQFIYDSVVGYLNEHPLE